MPTISLDQAHKLTAKAMAGFFKNIVSGQSSFTDSTTTKILAPLVSAMEYEGYENLKPPCNTSDLINKASNTCFKGQPWVQEFALATWIDVSWNKNITVVDNENFHNAATVYPYHHPEIEDTCAGDI